MVADLDRESAVQLVSLASFEVGKNTTHLLLNWTVPRGVAYVLGDERRLRWNVMKHLCHPMIAQGWRVVRHFQVLSEGQRHISKMGAP